LFPKREAGIADSLSGRRAVLSVTLGTATFVRLVNLL
jgi:branched-subunit amino acid transport protein AzlD